MKNEVDLRAIKRKGKPKDKEEFSRKELDYWLKDEPFKGLTKDWIISCIFDEEIQKKWKPSVGDIIVGPTGNIFVISGSDALCSSLGGKRWYFGGGSCNRDGGIALDSTYSMTANECGNYYHPTRGKEERANHTSIRRFRFVPYPHELVGKRKEAVHAEYFETLGDLLAWLNSNPIILMRNIISKNSEQGEGFILIYEIAKN